jgi:hypothetical protein
MKIRTPYHIYWDVYDGFLSFAVDTARGYFEKMQFDGCIGQQIFEGGCGAEAQFVCVSLKI